MDETNEFIEKQFKEWSVGGESQVRCYGQRPTSDVWRDECVIETRQRLGLHTFTVRRLFFYVQNRSNHTDFVNVRNRVTDFVRRVCAPCMCAASFEILGPRNSDSLCKD